MIRALTTFLFIVAALAGCVSPSTPSATTMAPDCPSPLVFLDLGNTVLDTKTHDFKKITYMPGAWEYLNSLKQQGFKVGLLVNVPEKWGATDVEKLKTLQDFIAKVWADERALDWSLFDAGIYFPPSDKLRKPHPFLFLHAARIAKEQGRLAIFQGEVEEELTVAAKSGLKVYKVGRPHHPFFMPPEDMRLCISDGNIQSSSVSP